LIYNARAGAVVVRRELASVVKYLEDKGWSLAVHETRAPLEATALARQAAARHADVVIAAGGDGTASEVASGLVHTGTALGVLPVGTTNVWALQMRIPSLYPLGSSSGLVKLVAEWEERMDQSLPLSHVRSVLLDAAQVLVEGNVQTIDVGQVGTRHFLMWAGVGFDAAVSSSVPPSDKKTFGMLAYVGTAVDLAKEYKSTWVTLRWNGRVERVRTPLIIVSNVQLYGAGLPIGARACLNDGKLDVCVFKGEGLSTFLHHVWKIVARQHVEDPEIEYYQTDQVIVEAERPLPVHADDEPFTETPVTIRVVPRALKVIVPADVPRELFAG
jgi:diacylglycerol kinase family enzyme